MLFFSMILPQNNTHLDGVNGFVSADSCLFVEAFFTPEGRGGDKLWTHTTPPPNPYTHPICLEEKVRRREVGFSLNFALSLCPCSLTGKTGSEVKGNLTSHYQQTDNCSCVRRPALLTGPRKIKESQVFLPPKQVLTISSKQRSPWKTTFGKSFFPEVHKAKRSKLKWHEEHQKCFSLNYGHACIGHWKHKRFYINDALWFKMRWVTFSEFQIHTVLGKSPDLQPNGFASHTLPCPICRGSITRLRVWPVLSLISWMHLFPIWWATDPKRGEGALGVVDTVPKPVHAPNTPLVGGGGGGLSKILAT